METRGEEKSTAGNGSEQSSPIIGRGALEGARLFRDWFQALATAPECNEKTAYVFVMGSFTEVLQVFDFRVSFPEITALQTAIRHVGQDYLNLAEDYGYSPDICGYIKADVGIALRQGDHPMGRIPKPSIAVLNNSCNTYIKWAEIWERLYRIPILTLDIPGSRGGENLSRPGDEDFERDRRYVEYQVRELIELCEKVSGKKFDIDRLRELMANTNRMAAAYSRVLKLNQHMPAPFNALSEGTIYLGVANAFRGTPEGSRYFEQLEEEMSYKVAHDMGTLREEKYRLSFVGVPCYPIFRRFYEWFAERGGAFVTSTYLQAPSGGLDVGFQYDLSRPIESLAEGILASVRSGIDWAFFKERELIERAREFNADAIVFHPIKSCRTVSTGLADKRRVISESSDLASLFIESDLVDQRVVAEASMRNRIDALFEGLASRKLRLKNAAA